MSLGICIPKCDASAVARVTEDHALRMLIYRGGLDPGCWGKGDLGVGY